MLTYKARFCPSESLPPDEGSREKTIYNLGLVFSKLKKWGECEGRSGCSASDSRETLCGVVCAGLDLWVKWQKSKDVYIRTERPLRKHLVKVTGRECTIQLSQTFREKLIKALKEQG